MLHIHDLCKQYGPKILFQGAEAHLGHHSRVALIGPNGAGKSTLIRLILDLESADSGHISKASRLSIGYLPQEVPKFSGKTVLEEIMRLDGRREELLKAKEELEEQFSKIEAPQSPSSSDLERYGRVLEELEHLDEYRIESRAKAIALGMGFSEKDFNRSLTEFSGGWLMRIALARILLLDPDLLLLDEPTNHLDLESLLWLEDFLRNFHGAILVISHDTAFLNRIVTEVFEIDQKKLWTYRGNLDSYVQQKEERITVLRAQYEGQQAKIAEIEAFVSRFGAKATKARQAQSRLKQLEKMELIELPDEKNTVRFRFPPAPHSGKEVITVKDAQMSFGTKTVFKDLNWVIRRGSRTAIVGVNGAGKTTLLKMIAQKLAPTSGEVKLGHEVKVGYYAQLQTETLNLGWTILKELETVAPLMPVSQVRAIAGAFLFSGDAVLKQCSVLSGGEKARVALAKLLLSPSNFLVLDEPTNHLDVESRGVLLEALQNYSGTLCLVSHDREFVAPLVDQVLEIEPDAGGSKVHQLVGSYEDYLNRKIKEISQSNKLSKLDLEIKNKNSSASPSDPSQGTSTRTTPSNNQKRAWKTEKDQLEADITTLEKSQARIQTELGDSKVYEDQKRVLALVSEQKEIQNQMGAKLSRWEELSLLLGE